MKFVRQIPGLPTTVAHLGNCIFRYLCDFGQIGGLPISPKWAKGSVLRKNCQLLYLGPILRAIFCLMGDLPIGFNWTNLNFLTIFHTKSILKGGLFIKQIANSCVWGPTGVCHSTQNGPILNVSTISCTKSKFKEGIFYVKIDISCI